MKIITINPRGFTLIEVVMIIVILGILAAVAVPRFVNLSDNAQQTALDGVANALAAASSINYSGCSSVANVVTPEKCVAITKCSDVAATILPALVLSETGPAHANTYNLFADSPVVGNGAEATCTLQYLKNGAKYISTYVVTGAGQ